MKIEWKYILCECESDVKLHNRRPRIEKRKFTVLDLQMSVLKTKTFIILLNAKKLLIT